MNQWILLVIIGVVALALGLGILSGLEVKELKLTGATTKPSGLAFSGIGLLCFLLGLLGMLGLLEAKKGPEPSAGPAPTSSAPSPSRSTPSTSPSQAPFSVTLSAPNDGATAPLPGTRVSGAVKGDLGDSALWLFTYSDARWYLTGSIEPSIDGSFEMDSGQLGEKNENGKIFRLEVLATAHAGTQKITDKHANSDGDVAFRSRPGQLAAKVRVKRE